MFQGLSGAFQRITEWGVRWVPGGLNEIQQISGGLRKGGSRRPKELFRAGSLMGISGDL